MKQPNSPIKPSSSRDNFLPLLKNIKAIISETQNQVVRSINSAIILAYFQIGRMILEDEQAGIERAEYAKETILHLSKELTTEFGKGYSADNLERFRKFYIIYQHRISASVMRKS